MYGIRPYSYHLDMVFDKATEFIYLIPEKDRAEVLAGCWVHDTLEDTHKTYNDVKKATNETVAEYAYALTNEKGRTRKDRANQNYYDEMRAYKHASFIKICDRMANVEFSKLTATRMFEMYKKENPYFREKLYDGRWDVMWNRLDEMFNDNV
jgi:(p)ppGpp synthase/HD superfamily hydrolase